MIKMEKVNLEKISYTDISSISIHEMYPFRRKKKLLLIRPRVPGDGYTELGSYDWAGLVKQRALDLGWEVTDLAINDATRENVESKINEIKPNLVIHYDHGGTFTLWGQEANALEPAIDSTNVGLLANRITSTVSCLSAGGLGPLAITNGATSYLGYDDLHAFVIGYQDRFGEAANAANYALLECKSVEEAYQAGIDAYNDLYADLIASGDVFAANWVLHDRDCFVLLGSTSANACPLVIYPFCRIGLPDSVIHCKPGLPDSMILCRIGLPNSIIQCKPGLPDSMIELECRAGPNIIIDKCGAGPTIEFDPERIPQQFKKPLMQLLDQIRMEK